MSLDPSLARPAASAVSVQPPGPDDSGEWAGRPQVTRVEILPLQPGDRVLVHVDGAAGMSAGGGEQIGRQVRALLRLDELGFGVPVLVVSPGIEVQVIRPS